MAQITPELFTILVVDDDPSVTASIAMLLKQAGFGVLTASEPQQAMSLLAQSPVHLVLQDMNFSRNTSGAEGMELLSQIKAQYSALPVILMTAWGSIELAVEGIKQGAADFLTKPWDNQQLLRLITTSLELNQTPPDSPLGRQRLDREYDFSAIVGDDPALIDVLATIARVAATDAPVLILGESGTGKELIADAIHINSKRAQQSLVKVNLGGMNATLFESEMFGHVRGAFTDAKQDRIGRFELANEGSIFLDEMGDLDPSSQVKLLRVLQDQSFQAVGSSTTRRANVRIISTTNRDLFEMVEDGSFREDLLYRVNLITIKLPPLRKRRGDIKPLAEQHLAKVSKLYGLGPLTLDDSALMWLQQQPWPGNIRQLCQTIERAILMSGASHLSSHHFRPNAQRQNKGQYDDFLLPVGSMTLDEMEKLMIEKAIIAYRSNLSKVAEALGISRAALYRRLEKYGLNA